MTRSTLIGPWTRRKFLAAGAAVPLAAPALATGLPGELRMEDLYLNDMSFSDMAIDLNGTWVRFSGFMAPPLRAYSDFFVLTGRPMSVCPFCERDSDWPPDIMAIYTRRPIRPISFDIRIETQGTLEIGGFTDPDTGFHSRVRIEEATLQRI